MPRSIDDEAGLAAIRESGELREASYLVSEPNDEGNRFLIAPRSHGRGNEPAADETGRFAREGA